MRGMKRLLLIPLLLSASTLLAQVRTNDLVRPLTSAPQLVIPAAGFDFRPRPLA